MPGPNVFYHPRRTALVSRCVRCNPHHQSSLTIPEFLTTCQSSSIDENPFIGTSICIGIDIWGHPGTCPANNLKTPILSSVITTIFPQYFGLPPIFLTSLRQCPSVQNPAFGDFSSNI